MKQVVLQWPGLTVQLEHRGSDMARLQEGMALRLARHLGDADHESDRLAGAGYCRDRETKMQM